MTYYWLKEMIFNGWKANAGRGFTIDLSKIIMGANVKISIDIISALYHIKNNIGGEEIRRAITILEEEFAPTVTVEKTLEL